MQVPSTEKRLRVDASAELYLNLGRIWALAGKPQSAREAFEQGLRIDPRHRALRQALRETASLLP